MNVGFIVDQGRCIHFWQGQKNSGSIVGDVHIVFNINMDSLFTGYLTC